MTTPRATTAAARTTRAAATCRAVRAGEEFDLPPCTRGSNRGSRDCAARRASRSTGRRLELDVPARVRSHDLVLRRPPAGTKAKSAHDMGREYRVQKALAPVYPVRARDDRALRRPGRHRRGVLRHARVSRASSRGRTCRASCRSSRDEVRRLCTNVLDTLVALHQVDHGPPGWPASARARATRSARSRAGATAYRKARTWNVPRGGR